MGSSNKEKKRKKEKSCGQNIGKKTLQRSNKHIKHKEILEPESKEK